MQVYCVVIVVTRVLVSVLYSATVKPVEQSVCFTLLHCVSYRACTHNNNKSML